MMRVRRRRGAGDRALHLRIGDALGQHRERLGRIVALLHLQRRPVDGRAVEPRRRAGLEPAQRKARAFERPGKAERRRLADPAGRDLPLADMDEAAQERAGGEHHRTGIEAPAIAEAHPGDDIRRPATRSSTSPSTMVKFGVCRSASCMAAA